VHDLLRAFDLFVCHRGSSAVKLHRGPRTLRPSELTQSRELVVDQAAHARPRLFRGVGAHHDADALDTVRALPQEYAPAARVLRRVARDPSACLSADELRECYFLTY